MKYLVMFFFLTTGKVVGQTNSVKVVGLYRSDWATTNWRLYLYENNTFEYSSIGHLGIGDTIHGTYKILNNILYTKMYDVNKRDSIDYLYRIDSDSCLTDLIFNNQLCHPTNEPPIPVDIEEPNKNRKTRRRD